MNETMAVIDGRTISITAITSNHGTGVIHLQNGGDNVLTKV
jgi:hypothetical protein